MVVVKRSFLLEVLVASVSGLEVVSSLGCLSTVEVVVVLRPASLFLRKLGLDDVVPSVVVLV